MMELKQPHPHIQINELVASVPFFIEACCYRPYREIYFHFSIYFDLVEGH